MKRGQDAVKAARAPQALELRIAGGTYRQIGQQLGVSEKCAYEDVQHELAKLDAVKVQLRERLRELELERCDRLTVALGRKAQAGDERAILALVRVMERRAKLLGLDHAQAVEHSGDVTFRWLDRDEK